AAQALGDAQSVSLGARLAYVHEPVDLFQGGRRVAEARVDLGAISASVYRRLGRMAGAALRVKAEHARWAEEVAAVDSAPINRTFVTVTGVAAVDTSDSGGSPRRGARLRAVPGGRGAVAHQPGGTG